MSAAGPAGGDVLEILRFEVEGDRYAVPAARVREVIPAVAVTPLVGTPPVIAGVVDVRGEILPVLDLRERFHLPRRPVRPEEQWVVVDPGSRPVVLRADAVLGLARVEAGAVTTARELTATAAPGVGLARLDDGLTLIYDPLAFLSDTEARAVREALGAGVEAG